MVGTSVPNTSNSFLCTAHDYGDFELELEFKVDPTLNSGIQIRSECFDKPTEVKTEEKTIKIPAGRVHGYQVEIDPSDRAWTAGIYDEGRPRVAQRSERQSAGPRGVSPKRLEQGARRAVAVIRFGRGSMTCQQPI